MHLRIILSLIAITPTWASGQTATGHQAAITYIQSLQQGDGGFLPAQAKSAPTASSLRATSSANRALKYFGGEMPKKESAAKFVASCFDEMTGGYADVPHGKPDVFVTAVGIMAATELGLNQEPFINKAVIYLTKNAKNFEETRIAAAGLEAAKQFPKEIVDGWLADVEKIRHQDGSYGEPLHDARMTGSAVALILRIGGKLDAGQRKASLEVLLAGQREDGAFGKTDAKSSDLETSYRVMRAFHMLDKKPKDTTKLKEFIGRCRNADGGYAVAPGQPSNASATYFASIILYWVK